MKFGAAEAAIRGYFNTGWGSTTPIAWPDLTFTPPNATWVRFSMKNDDGFQASMGDPGNNRHRRIGTVFIQVFQPQGQASTDARAKADKAADIFLANTLTGVLFKNVNARDIGPDGNGFYQWNVTANFQYDRLT